MMQVLSDSAIIQIDGKYQECKAVLARTHGGKQVIYMLNGTEIRREPLSRSPFRDFDKQDTPAAVSTTTTEQDTNTTTELDVWRNAYDDALLDAYSTEYSRLIGDGVDANAARTMAGDTAKKQAKAYADTVLSAYKAKNK